MTDGSQQESTNVEAKNIETNKVTFEKAPAQSDVGFSLSVPAAVTGVDATAQVPENFLPTGAADSAVSPPAEAKPPKPVKPLKNLKDLLPWWHTQPAKAKHVQITCADGAAADPTVNAFVRVNLLIEKEAGKAPVAVENRMFAVRCKKDKVRIDLVQLTNGAKYQLKVSLFSRALTHVFKGETALFSYDETKDLKVDLKMTRVERPVGVNMIFATEDAGIL